MVLSLLSIALLPLSRLPTRRENLCNYPGKSARHLVVSCRLPAMLAQPSNAAVNQLLRVRIGDDDRTRRSHRQRVEERLRHVRRPACPLQETNDFALVVGNRKFIEGANATGDENHDIGTPYSDNVAPFEPKARVDHDRRGTRWCVIQRGVLA